MLIMSNIQSPTNPDFNSSKDHAQSGRSPQDDLLSKLWIYTNYHCNLRCSYCVASSTPLTPKQVIGLEAVEKLVDEAISMGFQEIFFTGGEPFILDEIYDMLAYSSQRVKTTVLTNAMLFKGRRMNRLAAVGTENLTVQVSLDGGRPEHHDNYRGNGTWAKTVDGIQRIQEHGFHVRLSTTETPANTEHLQEICDLHLTMGIPEQDHFIRPLAKRGFSQEGMEVTKTNLLPEITVNKHGVYWHPLSTDADMQVSTNIFPLAEAVACIQEELDGIANGSSSPDKFT
jgi:MoaA/NifB/PqqE/SkfB family radical SAM enzyme